MHGTEKTLMRPRYFMIIPMLVLTAFMLPLRLGFTDDGFIHLQYAKNLIEHGEFAFNVGEPSFGTTSPLWVMALAAVGARLSSPESMVDVSRVLSWCAAFATLFVVYRLTRASGGSRTVAVCATTAFAANAWFARWSALGMESSAATLAAAVVALTSLRASENASRAARFGVAVAIAALLRPEFYLALPVFVAAAAMHRPRPALRTVVIAGLAVGVLLAPWLAFAKWHLGSFLPNTAGAKSGGLVTNPWVFAIKSVPILKIVLSSQTVSVVAILADVWVSRRRAVVFDRGLRFCVLWAVALPFAYVLLDVQVLSRYLLLTAPAICVVGWRSLEHAAGVHARRVAVWASVLAVAANAVFYARIVLPPSRAFSADLTGPMTQLALHLRDNSPPDAVVAAADIGYLAFYSQRRVLDLGGLVEPETGKLRSQYEYEDIIARGLYFDVPGYPHVDYFVDRKRERNRFEGKVIHGHRLELVHTTDVENLGIRKPGVYHYALYRVTPVEP
jgi:hypothetical protein